MLYEGTLNVYFPCELKNSQEIKHIRRMWNDILRCHRNISRAKRSPNTNQMDILAFRTQKENMLKAYQALWALRFGVSLPCYDAGCYATPELADEYRHPREDNLFVKSTSLQLSSFDVKYGPLTDKNENVIIQGKLLFSVNIDNRVATAILVLNFENLNVDDLIVLKHTFYKRCQVAITEDGKEQKVNTFQEYVTSKLRPIYPFIKNDVDCRARYMLMEVVEPIVIFRNINQRERIIYGLLTCDEGWRHALNFNKDIGKNYSNRNSFQLYYNKKNALIVTSQQEHSQYIREKRAMWRRNIIPAPKHIEPPRFPERCDIAGVDKQLFAKYLKTVELDYLITSALTSEISSKIKKSIYNLFALICRAIKLWKILNDLDLNIYHIDKSMHQSFGVTKNMCDIRQEYNEIVNLVTNYFILLVALLTLWATIK